jgi:peptide/nickel transport system substrate-binding protein
MKILKCEYVILICLLVVGYLCLPLASVARGETKIVVAIDTDIPGMMPSLAYERVYIRVLRHLYDDLFTRDSKNKVIPCLAESYKSLDDLTWRIKLRRGIKFNNGELFNSESAKFTIDFILKPANKSMFRVLIDRIDQIKIVDDYTIDIITKKPFPTLLECLIDVSMVPPMLAKEKGMEYLANNPCGTGPYRLESWTRDREIRLIKNERYWLGAPEIDKVVFRVIPEMGAQVSALLAGEVDLIGDVPPQFIKQINNSGIASVKSTAGRRVNFIGLDTVKEGPMKDLRVRQAMNYGVDVDEIIRTVMEGHATRVAGPLTHINKHFDPSLKPYPYDPEMAKKLLKEAGYGSGLTVTFDSSERWLKTKEYCEAIVAQLAKIGVNAKLKFHEWGTYSKLSHQQKLGDMMAMSRQDRELDGGIMYSYFKTGRPWSNFSDPEIDTELDKVVSIVNPDKRAEAMKNLQTKMQKIAPWIFLWEQHELYGVSNRLDWTPRGDEQFFFHINTRVKK